MENVELWISQAIARTVALLLLSTSRPRQECAEVDGRAAPVLSV